MRTVRTVLAIGLQLFVVVLLMGPTTASAASHELTSAGKIGTQRLDGALPGAAEEERFEKVFDGTAVLDREMGLIWEQSPEPVTMNWEAAVNYCSNLELGGEKRWHLASLEELTSLMDLSVLGSPKLPINHPFDTGCKLGGCVQASTYWSGSLCEDNAEEVWLVCLCNGSLARHEKNAENYAWCVRDKD